MTKPSAREVIADFRIDGYKLGTRAADRMLTALSAAGYPVEEIARLAANLSSEAITHAKALDRNAKLFKALEAAEQTVLNVADRLNDACENGEPITGSAYVDPLMFLHRELLAALALAKQEPQP